MCTDGHFKGRHAGEEGRTRAGGQLGPRDTVGWAALSVIHVPSCFLI